MKKVTAYFTAFVLLTLLFSCKEKDPETGKINLVFLEFVDGLPLAVDSVRYENEAGNEYLISEVQYFISDVRLYYQDGNSYEIKDNQGIHYVDTDIPGSKEWHITDDVPSGVLDSIVFTFGLDEETNKSGLFTDPPESNMFWPDELGGGYHYMKLNGKWLDTQMMLSPFNFHLGIGQIRDTTGQVTGFVQNYFKVNVYLAIFSSFIMAVDPGQTTDLGLIMNIDSWLKTPHIWDFNQMGGMMMQNQDALKAACENGFDVFTIGPVYAH
jgi:hypothetical protein